VYLSAGSAPLPAKDAPLLDFKEYRKDEALHSSIIDRRLSIAGSADVTETAGASKKARSKHMPKSNHADTSLARMVGYTVKRGDFDTEYDNDEEFFLSDMEFLDSDTPSERQLKLEVIAEYNRTLDERQRRKDFILDRELLVPCVCHKWSIT
jgi:hypothetical protein